MKLKLNYIEQNYVPLTWCQKHKIRSDPLFYKEDKEKLYLNWDKGDRLYNSSPFYTLAKWTSPSSHRYKYLNSKYHVDETFLDIMHQHITIEAKPMPSFCRSRVSEYTATYRPYIRSIFNLPYQPYVTNI